MKVTEGKSGNGANVKRRDPAVRSVQRASYIMQVLFRAAPRGLRVSEISRETGLHKTTVVRLLQTLCGINLVRQDERTDCYMWEPLTWVTLMNNIRNQLSPLEAIETILRGLAKSTGETVMLVHPDTMARHMSITAFALPDTATSIDPGPWRSAPMHCSAAGKAYLTGKTVAELETWGRSGLPPVTPKSITSLQTLIGDIARAKDKGYALAVEERMLGAFEVGVPLRDNNDKIVGGLQLCARAELVTEQHIKEWTGLLTEASAKLASVLYLVGVDETIHTAKQSSLGQNGVNAESAQTERTGRSYRVF